jgi:uncharacterized protein DUF4236
MACMGIRFRRRLRVLPGHWLNLSKSGVSTSIGGHGATLNLSKRGKMTTLGSPGSGLSYRSRREPWAPPPGPKRGGNAGMIIATILALAIIAGVLLAAR